ncbi:MAG: hypothetical protein NVS9B4_15750 [Candidatus Acidiferrum sp.]
MQYKTEVQFDAQEFWLVRLVMQSSAGSGEALSKVEATPAGLSRWDLLFFLLPFMGVGVLWFRAMAKKRSYRKQLLQVRRVQMKGVSAGIAGQVSCVRRGVPLLLLVVGAAILAGCRSENRVPAKSSSGYSEAVSTFYVGLAALEVGDDVTAENKLSRVTQLAPGEPAGWGNWGALALRQRNFDTAATRIERARKIAPQNDHIYYLLGILESGRGRSKEAIADLRKATEINPHNLRAIYKLAEELERQGAENSDAEFEALMEKILTEQPGNLAALLELSRMSAKRGDTDTLKRAVAQIGTQSSAWPAEVRQQVVAVQTAATGPDPRAAATRTIFLRNVLVRIPDYRQSLAAIKSAPGEEAEPFTHFLKMESPVFAPSPADMAISFVSTPINQPNEGDWNWVGAMLLSSAGPSVIAQANGREVQLSSGVRVPFPGGAKNEPPQPEGVLSVDFDNDFKPDLVLAGAGGVRFWRQESPSQFRDVTPQTKLSKALLNADYTGAWAADIEADGDLDVVLGSANGAPVVLRNNGDGSFTATYPFAGVRGVRQFVWADLDGDGNPDASMIDGAGRLRVLGNERAGQFRERALPADLPSMKAINVADVDNDGVFDLLAVEATGAVVALSNRNDGQSWEQTTVASVPDSAGFLAGEVRLHVADLDNNGGVDLIVAQIARGSKGTNAAGVASPANGQGALIWLSDENNKFRLLDHAAGPSAVLDVADVNHDGRLDLLGLSVDGQPVQALSQGTKNYHFQVIRTKAAQASGDQRINSFGVGGEMELRSGLLLQKMPIRGPQVHFGMGQQNTADVVRVLWPNGSARAEFDMKGDQEIVTEQRLKGSCPYLFAFNGKQTEFVKDAVPWGSALGMRVNAKDIESVEATEEWYKIGRDELAPRNGSLDLSITAELWEIYFYDYIGLMTVDHPVGTEIFVDERYVKPAPKPSVTAVAEPHKIARAIDDRGQDVTDIVSSLDGRYLDTFGRGKYPGFTRDHYVEVDLGDGVPASGPLWLILQGWLRPSDSSINVAMAHGQHNQPQWLSLEVPDGRGGWVVAKPNLGAPAGRNKTCMIDLTNVFRAETPRRVRLRTNLEIYWDNIEWAQGLPQTELRTTRLTPSAAELRYRGYSAVTEQSDSSPEVPDYNRVAGTTQRWRNLSGYYTRFGDVTELLTHTDDRYVIVNSGDEMAMHFSAPPPPPSGWVRDYVIIGDGWIKDGDYNSTFARTVQPLPYHGKRKYQDAPRSLQDEWAYRQHPRDWQTYHTRFVAPQGVENALRGPSRK